MNSICIRKHEKGRKEGFVCLKHPVNGEKTNQNKTTKKVYKSLERNGLYE